MIKNNEEEELNFQVNKRREVKQKSFFYSQCSLRQVQSIDLSENQNCQIKSDVSTSPSETQPIGSLIKFGSDIFTSVTQTTKFQCNKCHLDIDENTTITPCEHTFHQNCFRELLNNELKKKEYYLKCLCGFEINQMLKIKYFKEDKTVYEEIIKFELENIRKYLGNKIIIECEGGPYKEQKYDEQLNIIFEVLYCNNAFYIFDQELGSSQQFMCGLCERKLFTQNTKPKIKLLNQQKL